MAEPALTHLQRQIAGKLGLGRLGLDSLIQTGDQRTQAGRTRAAVVMGLGLAIGLNGAAVAAALIQALK